MRNKFLTYIGIGLMAFATGCGGYTGSSVPSSSVQKPVMPTEPKGLIERVVPVNYDFDNDGVRDAVGIYENDFRVPMFGRMSQQQNHHPQSSGSENKLVPISRYPEDYISIPKARKLMDDAYKKMERMVNEESQFKCL